MAAHSSTLAWKIPGMEEPGRLQSMGSWRVRHDWVTSLSLFTFMHWRRKWQPTPVSLPGRIPGTGEPGGLPSVGSQRVGHDWSDLAAAAAAWFQGEYSVFCHQLCCYCLVTKLWQTLLQSREPQPARLLRPWDFPAKYTGVGCYFLLQGILPTQGSNLSLLHWQANLLLAIREAQLCC